VNKIAAGEVVERPAAVVKELLENSIDAGGRTIVVGFSRGGKFSITVEDDGCGMCKEEALLAMKRHATSKLRDVQDLESLSTFGFRGEALPSIASVSRFRLVTCRDDDDSGVEIFIDGGVVTKTMDCTKRRGTKIAVENLFYNVPARRKFLKSDETEGAHIVYLLNTMALAKSEVEFSLFQNGVKIFSSPTSRNISDRINEIFKHEEKFIEFSYSGEGITMSGAICDPSFGNVCKKHLVTFVNGRLVRNDMIVAELCANLRPIFPNHRGILAYIFLTVDPASVDVNVHPMKKEVRFRNEMMIRGFIKSFVDQTFNSNISVVSQEATSTMTPIVSKNIFTQRISTPLRSNGMPRHAEVKDILTSKFAPGKIPCHRQETFDITEHTSREEWKFIGTVFGDIALFESISGLIIFNIKSAASRVVYEKILLTNDIEHVQQLLIPIEFSLPASSAERLEKFLPTLTAHGFSLYAFGKHDYKIDAIPEWISHRDAVVIVTDFIAKNENSSSNIDSINLKQSFAECASRGVDPGKYKTQSDIEKLRDALLACQNPLLCPSGNATYFEFPLSDMSRRFAANNPQLHYK
jgi:DNA mismatch repair protein MutL